MADENVRSATMGPAGGGERRIDMAGELYNLRLDLQKMLHDMQVCNADAASKAAVKAAEAAAAAATATATAAERAALRQPENGNGKKSIIQYLGVPGAILAASTLLFLYHNNLAMPAVRTASAEAVKELLKDPLLWAQIREISRETSTTTVSKELADIKARLAANERIIDENTRYIDQTSGRERIAPRPRVLDKQ